MSKSGKGFPGGSRLTVVPGGARPRPFSMNGHGVAKFMAAGPYAARRVIEGYAFPDEDRAKIILPVPAKDIVWTYFRQGRSQTYLDGVVAELESVPPGEKPFARGRRRSALNVAKHLAVLGPKLDFREPHRRPMGMQIAGLPVRGSIDFVCKLPDGRVIAVIFNVAAEVDGDELVRFARVECEIAWRVTRAEMPAVAEVWYVDTLSEKVVRKHVKSHQNEWRNIETTCDNILIGYRVLLARRERQQRLPA
jgi:hypothetical protein